MAHKKIMFSVNDVPITLVLVNRRGNKCINLLLAPAIEQIKYLCEAINSSLTYRKTDGNVQT